MLKTRFKKAREHAGYTQETAAQAAGVSQTAIFKIEKGETLRPRKINIYANLFGCSPEWLMYGTNTPEWIESPHLISESAPAYITRKQLSLDDKKLLYCAIIAAKETLENGKAISGDNYGFKELATTTVLKFDEYIEKGLSANELIAELNDSIDDVDSAMSV
ncbi:helix-turn-helix domain-containing protein [Neptuniibacter pectenicola]|uniref:helix-turn-helix domain-containing protein n=1 Tax=Neptuniibacter pectenicola TaxID=1806669 RepID=UPI00082D720C|nr:helix-turn-helix transcriptional regulator [Neptuniibacter pectenicola]